MRPISCCKQDRRPENVFGRQLCDGGSGKDPVRDAIFSVSARNESRVLSLMSALPVNAGTPTSPMRMLSRCSERPLDVPIERPQHADAPCISGPRSSAAMISASTGGLPRFKILFGLRKLHDESAASRRVTSLRPPGSRMGSSKGRAQAAAGFNCAISYPSSGMC